MKTTVLILLLSFCSSSIFAQNTSSDKSENPKLSVAQCYIYLENNINVSLQTALDVANNHICKNYKDFKIDKNTIIAICVNVKGKASSLIIKIYFTNKDGTVIVVEVNEKEKVVNCEKSIAVW